GPDGQVHGAADSGNGVGLARAPVGQVARGRYLEGTEHADVEVAATHHAEAVGVMEIGAARQQGDGLLAGIDQVVVFLTLGRGFAHAQNAVLTVQDDFAVGGKVVGNQGGHADAQVHVRTVGDVAGDALGDFLLRACFVIGHVMSFSAKGAAAQADPVAVCACVGV